MEFYLTLAKNTNKSYLSQLCTYGNFKIINFFNYGTDELLVFKKFNFKIVLQAKLS